MSAPFQLDDSLAPNPIFIHPSFIFRSDAALRLSVPARAMLIELTNQAHEIPSGLLHVGHGFFCGDRNHPSLQFPRW